MSYTQHYQLKKKCDLHYNIWCHSSFSTKTKVVPLRFFPESGKTDLQPPSPQGICTLWSIHDFYQDSLMSKLCAPLIFSDVNKNYFGVSYKSYWFQLNLHYKIAHFPPIIYWALGGGVILSKIIFIYLENCVFCKWSILKIVYFENGVATPPKK